MNKWQTNQKQKTNGLSLETHKIHAHTERHKRTASDSHSQLTNTQSPLPKHQNGYSCIL